MDALHSCINQKDGDYHPQVAVISKKCQQPCSQDNTSPDNGEEPYAVLLDIAANEYNRRRTCQSAQTECPDNIVIRKEWLLLHPESKATPQRKERAISQCRPQRSDTQVRVFGKQTQQGFHQTRIIFT